MSLPRRRRGRPRGRARLALTGDFPATDHDITEAMEAIPPAPWDGTTISLSDLRGQPRYPHGHFTGIGDETTWHPAPGWAERRGIAPADAAAMLARARPPVPDQPRPPILLAGQQAPWIMTVNPPRPGDPGPTPQALEVARFLRAKVIILKRRGHVDRISQEKLAMLPADRIRNRRTTARLIVDEAAELLRCGGEPR
jgi:hypothetical protein